MSRTIAVVLSVLVLAAIGGAVGYAFLHAERAHPAAAQGPEAAVRADSIPSEVGETVFLTVREPPPGNPTNFPVELVYRELMRQAFLIAARDELGLSTRDVLLREDFPEQPDAKSLPFEIFAGERTGQKNEDLEIVLKRPKLSDKALWRFSINLFLDNPASLATLTEKAEAFSRGELKDALLAAGAKGTVPARRASGDIPKTDLLWSWNEISVLAGLRLVHGENRAKGESPELLAALAIGYANLGNLTEYQYSAACKAYYARGLLYAERLVRQTNESAWALWHRAYARMMYGAHKLANEDIATAKAKHESGGRPLPCWAGIIEAFGQGAPAQMMKIAQSPEERRLALYLNVQAVLFGDLKDLTVQAVHDLLEECPDFTRGYDILAASGELGPGREGAYSGFQRTGQFLRKRLPDVAGLAPPTVWELGDREASQEAAAEILFRNGLAASINAAGAPDLDRGEPSLSSLGHMIEEIDFAQALRRLEFDANMFGIPTDESVKLLRPLCPNHPYVAYLAAFQRNKSEKERAADQLIKRLDPTVLTYKQRPMLRWMLTVTKLEMVSTWDEVTRFHSDTVLSDLVRDIQAGYAGRVGDPQNDAYMLMLSKASDKLPVVIALRIQRDWLRAEREAMFLERTHADDPFVMRALANQYWGLVRYDDAERCAKRLVEIHRDIPSYRLLASIYKVKKDFEHWKETLEKALELPANGLEHASIRNEIALYLIEHKKFKEAVVYADEAAQSYSGWSMLTAGRCHELLGDWDRAEELFHAVSERYENSIEEWMCWCHRTGHGDVKAADEFTRTKLESRGKSLYASQYRELGNCYLLTGELEKARSSYNRALASGFDPYIAFHVALIADHLGDVAQRDARLKQIAESMPAPASPGSKPQDYRPLAVQLRTMLATKGAKLNFEEVDKILDEAPVTGLNASTLPTFVGAFLNNRGEGEAAKRYLIRSAQSKDWNTFNNTLACQLLREMKIKIPPEEPRAK